MLINFSHELALTLGSLLIGFPGSNIPNAVWKTFHPYIDFRDDKTNSQGENEENAKGEKEGDMTEENTRASKGPGDDMFWYIFSKSLELLLW